MKLIKRKHIQKLHLNKRIRTGENYPETIIAMSENVTTSSTAKLPKALVINTAIYYFFSSLNP